MNLDHRARGRFRSLPLSVLAWAEVGGRLAFPLMTPKAQTPLIGAAVLMLAAGTAWIKVSVTPPPAAPLVAAASGLEVWFSPKGGCTEAVVKELDGARKTVLMQAYSFTSAPIAKALVEAYRRGVKVEAILDKSQDTERYSEADFLVNAGVPTFIDAAHAIAHNKVMVIDGETVLTGSFNFTKAAEERNAENLLILRNNPALAEKYARNWAVHRAHSTKFARATPTPTP